MVGVVEEGRGRRGERGEAERREQVTVSAQGNERDGLRFLYLCRWVFRYKSLYLGRSMNRYILM